MVEVNKIKELIEKGEFKELEKLIKNTPIHEIAEIFDELDEYEMRKILDLLTEDNKLILFENLEIPEQKKLLDVLNKREKVFILNNVSSEKLADLFSELPRSKQIELQLLMEEDLIEEIKELMKYKPESAGGIMTKEFVALPGDITVEEAIDILRKSKKKIKSEFWKIFVVDRNNRLIGAVKIHDLLFSSPEVKLIRLAKKTPKVYIDTDQEVVANLISKYDVEAIPVVDREGHIKGIVEVDTALDVLENEATEDIYKFGAAGNLPHDYVHAGILRIARSRAIWLTVLVFASFGSTFVIEQFTNFIGKKAFLAMFMPVVAGCAGNAGTQAASVMIRGLATGFIEFRDLIRILLKELAIGMIIGPLIGVLLAIRASFSIRIPQLFLCLILTMSVTITLATVMGAFLPFALKKAGTDPAHASGPLTTTLTDIFSLAIYFGIAWHLLK